MADVRRIEGGKSLGVTGCLFLVAASCVTETRSAEPASSAEDGLESTDAVVDFGQARQVISGFGASSAWTASSLSEAQADRLFSTESGIGLSLLRIRVQPNGASVELVTAERAMARGAKIWATPWSPPGEWKTNGSATDGGALRVENYGDWADRLASFAKGAADRGVPLLMLSAQNEPNWTAEWETCRFTQAELTTFIRDFLGPALAGQGLSTKIVTPETTDWMSLPTYGDHVLADPRARSFVGAVATHSYDGTAFSYAAASQHGKEFWQTEVSDPDKRPDPGMGSALRVAKMIHDHLTVANVNAWHYWWLVPRADTADDNSALMNQDRELTRRGYAMGNFSKFVRPGFVRVEATSMPQSDVLLTAFRNPNGRRLAIVAINRNASEVVQRFIVGGATISRLVPWITSASLALSSGAPVAVSGSTIAFSLPASSITTFVGDGDGMGTDGGAEPRDAESRHDAGIGALGCACQIGTPPRPEKAWVFLLAASMLAGLTRARISLRITRAGCRAPRRSAPEPY